MIRLRGRRVALQSRLPVEGPVAPTLLSVRARFGGGQRQECLCHSPDYCMIWSILTESSMSDNSDWMSAAEAAKALGIHRATLYAYVSRGLIRSEALPGRRRERRYSRQDVERLRRRNGERHDPEKVGRTLQWGMPILEAALTLI